MGLALRSALPWVWALPWGEALPWVWALRPALPWGEALPWARAPGAQAWGLAQGRHRGPTR